MGTVAMSKRGYGRMATRLSLAQERLPGELCYGDQILGHVDPVADELRLYLNGPRLVTGLDSEGGHHRVAWRHPDNEDNRGETRFPSGMRLVVCVST